MKAAGVEGPRQHQLGIEQALAGVLAPGLGLERSGVGRGEGQQVQRTANQGETGLQLEQLLQLPAAGDGPVEQGVDALQAELA